jgi:hypothetical protein
MTVRTGRSFAWPRTTRNRPRRSSNGSWPSLRAENGLAGYFRVAGEEEVALEVASASRHFLHDGILFAALDAVNDPAKNPTLNLLSGGDPPTGGEPPS